MNPIKQGLREVLVSVHNGNTSADTIAKNIGVARSTVVERLRHLRESGHINAYNNSFKATDKGIETILHAPVIKKGDQVHVYARAHVGKTLVVNRPPYLGIELKVNPGITDDRLEAFKLPSRRGNKLFYPDGRVEDV